MFRHPLKPWIFALFSASMLHPLCAQSITYQWTGANSSLFTDPLNWTPSPGAPSGSTSHAEAQLNVNNTTNNPLIYTATEGTTVFASSGINRGLVIGSLTDGNLIIEGGTLSTQGAGMTDVIGNAAGKGTLTLRGGTFLGNAHGLELGISGGGTSIVTIDDGTMDISLLRAAAANSTVTLNGGVLRMNQANGGQGTNHLVLNGGTIQAKQSNANFLQGFTSATLQSGGAQINSNGHTITINQAFSGNGGLTKIASGDLTLNGNNSYLGVTQVLAGTLTIRHQNALGTGAGGTTVSSGAALRLANNIQVTGETVTIHGTGGDNLGALRAIEGTSTWGGNIIIGSNDARIGTTGNSTLLLTGTIQDGTGNKLNIRTADTGGVVEVSGVSNYTGETHVIVGNMRLAGGNDRLPTGTTLRIGNTSEVAFARFDLNGVHQNIAGLTSDGGNMLMDLTNTSATASTLTINQISNLTYNGKISGNLSVVKTGAGVLTLAGSGSNNQNNTFTGDFRVQEGQVHLNKNGGNALSGDVYLSGGSWLTFARNEQIADTASIFISDTGSTLNGKGYNVEGRSPHVETVKNLTMTGGIFNAGGTSVWNFTGEGDLTGGAGNTTVIMNSSAAVSFEKLTVRNMQGVDGGSASMPNAFTLFGNGTAGQTVLEIGAGGLTLENARIALRRGTGANTLGSRLTLNGDVVVNGSGQTSYLVIDNNDGSVGSSFVELNGQRTFQVNGNNTLATNLILQNGSNSTGGIVKTGSGILRTSGNLSNTYTGLTTIQEGEFQAHKETNIISIAGDIHLTGSGKLTLARSNQFSHSTGITMDSFNAVLNGRAANNLGTLVSGEGISGTTQTIRSLTVNGGIMNAAADGRWTILETTLFQGGSGNASSLYIGNSGSSLTTNGLTLRHMTATAGGNVGTANSFTIYGNHASRQTLLTVGSAGLHLENSVLNLRRGGSGTQGSALILNGTVSTSGSAQSRIIEDTNGGTAGTRDLHLSGNSGNVMREFQIAGGGADLTIGVPMVKGQATTAGILKTGAGKLTLTQENQYDGKTDIQQGTLALTGQGNVGQTSEIHVASGASFDLSGRTNNLTFAGDLTGTGTVNTGSRDLVVTGRVLPGESPGTLNVQGNMIFGTGSTYVAEVSNGAHDRLNVTGTLAIDPNSKLEIQTLETIKPFAGNLDTATLAWLVINDGSDAINGIFENTEFSSEWASVLGNNISPYLTQVGSETFLAFYDANYGASGLGMLSGGNDLLLLAVPEPDKTLFLLLAGTPWILRRRR